MKAPIKAGIMLSITSWENDGDNYNTKTKTGLCEDEAKFWLALAKLFGGDDYANKSENTCIDQYELAREFLKLTKVYHSGFACATDGWDVSAVQVILSEDDDEQEEQLEQILSLGSELQYDVLGSCEYTTYRVFESYTAFLVPQDINEMKLD